MLAWFKFSILFQMMAIGLIGLIPVYWREVAGFSQADIGYINAVSFTVAILSPILFGQLGRTVSIQIPIRLAFWSFSLGSLILIWIKTPIAAVLFYSLIRSSMWGFMTLVPAGVLRLLKGQVATQYGQYRRFGSMGFLGDLLGIGYVSDLVGTEIIFPVMALAALLAGGPFLFKIEIAPNKESSSNYKQLLFRSDFRTFLFFSIVISISFGISFVYLPIRMHEMHSSPRLSANLIYLRSDPGVTRVLR